MTNTNIKIYCVVAKHDPNNVDNKLAARQRTIHVCYTLPRSRFEPLCSTDKQQF